MTKLMNKRIFLPQTTFQINIKTIEQASHDRILSIKGKLNDFYDWQLNSPQRKSLPSFELLDGPPYANGRVHVGHAINKLYKDFVVRSQVYSGKRVYFRPGWDCHGLPIELKIMKSHEHLTSKEVRNAAHALAEHSIALQMDSFKRWGVTADWENPYRTMDKNYVSRQIQLFGLFFDQKIIYRAFRPVYWSPSSKTALAESELEYNANHVSTAVFFRFLIINSRKILEKCGVVTRNSRLYGLVWTTTPWTLPFNNAVAFNCNDDYVVVQIKKEQSPIQNLYILSKNSISNFEEITNLSVQHILTLDKRDLQDLMYKNCMYSDIAQGFIDENFVKSDTGTGLVHIAFAHGIDDFKIGRRRGHKIQCFIDENGCYTRQMGYALENKNVLGDGEQAVLRLLKNDIIFKHSYQHSYPYDWRTKEPVIILSSEQWFMDISKAISKTVELIENGSVEIGTPYKDRSTSLLAEMNQRPPWCISRQRVWGVPIPAFFSKNGNILAGRGIAEEVAKKIAVDGPDVWWTLDVDELLSDQLRIKHGVLNGEKLTKCLDVMDVWMDSGVCWSCTRNGEQPADIVIEGVDQLRGWFQSLLLTSLSLHDIVPYKRALIHNFAVDDLGKKMSKSDGNVVDPDMITDGSLNMNPIGIDGLRLWVALYGTSGEQARIGKAVVDELAMKIREIRSILRYILGCVDSKKFDISLFKLHYIDRYILHETALFINRCKLNYQKYKFGTLVHDFLRFINLPLSSLYIHFIKDRLYCGSKTDRECVQYTLSEVGLSLVSIMAPIIPHLAIEFFDHHPGIEDPAIALRNCWNSLCVLDFEAEKLDVMFKKIEELRSEIREISNPQQNLSLLGAKILSGSEDAKILKFMQTKEHSFNSELVEALNLSMVELQFSTDFQNTKIVLIPSDGKYCTRCRRNRRLESKEYCDRCINALIEYGG